MIFHSQQLNRSIGKPTWFINRLRTDRYWIQALLTISCSGSILNPGPTKFPCGYCSKPVKSNQKAICCDNCDVWYHVRCMDMPPEVYEALNNSYTSWICCDCGFPNFSSSLFTSHSSLPCSNSFCSISSPVYSDSSHYSPMATSSPVYTRQPRKHPKAPKFLIVNLQGIRSKSAELEHLLNDQNIDLLIATETHLSKEISNAEILPDFQVFRKDRNSSGGGVLIAVRSSFNVIPRPDLDTNCEIIWIEILTQGQSTLFGSFYRPPSDKLPTIEALEESLQKVSEVAGNRQIILGGDFNLPSIDWDTLTIKTPARDSKQCIRMLDIAHDHFLNQLVLEPTQYGPSSANTLDLLFASKPDLVSDINVSAGISDHHLVSARLNRNVHTSNQACRKVFNFNKGNQDSFCNDMKRFTDHFVTLNRSNNQTVEQNWSNFRDTILLTAEQHFPSKTIKPRPNCNPWFNRNLRRLSRKKQRLFRAAKLSNSPSAWSKYKALRKKTTYEINKTRNEYVASLLDEHQHSNPKKFWKYIKSKKQDCVSIPPLKVNNVTITESKAKADALNSYFGSVFTSTHVSESESPQSTPFPSINDVHVTTQGIVNLINKMKPNKASVPDKIPARLLKLIPREAATILKVVFQQSLNSGIVPLDWSHAFVTPIHKKGARSDPTNYRSISLTSISCKLLEHILASHVMQHLDHHNLLTPFQHGFRQNHSCETQLIITIHDLAKALDNHNQTDLILLDFSKAFDSVPHNNLVRKLDQYEIRGQLLA